MFAHRGRNAGKVSMRRDPDEDSPKRIVRGNAIGHWQVLTQPVALHLAPFDNWRPALRATDHRADRRQQQFVQLIGAFVCTRIALFFECLQQRYRSIFHLAVRISSVKTFSGEITSTIFGLCSWRRFCLDSAALARSIVALTHYHFYVVISYLQPITCTDWALRFELALARRALFLQLIEEAWCEFSHS